MRFRTFLLLAFFFAWFGKDGKAQSSNPPDCKFTFSLTANGRAPTANGFINGTTAEPGCVTWTMVYYVRGFSAISLRLESADASGTGGAAGTWGAFSGTTLAGANPGVTTSQAFFTVQGFNPWVSVSLNSSTGSGTVYGTAYGWKVPGFSYVSATVTPAGTQDVNLIQVGGVAVSLGQKAMAASIPVVIASDQTPFGAFLGCTSQVEVALSSTSYTEIVAGTAAQTIKVCKIFVTSVSGGNPTVNTISVARATATSCASPTELLSAGGVTGFDSDFGGALRSGSGQSICVSESVANSDKVTITYLKN